MVTEDRLPNLVMNQVCYTLTEVIMLIILSVELNEIHLDLYWLKKLRNASIGNESTKYWNHFEIYARGENDKSNMLCTGLNDYIDPLIWTLDNWN